MKTEAAKHTPGPWRVRSRLVGPLEIIQNIDGSQPIALVGADTFTLCAANAELIAAAPDMLALLKDIHLHGYTTSQDHDRVAVMIAKAEGRS